MVGKRESWALAEAVQREKITDTQRRRRRLKVMVAWFV
jgi:hypothetical protein